MYAIVWSETRRAGVVAARMEGKRLAAMTVLADNGSLTVGLRALRAPAQFIVTKQGEEAQTGPAEYLADLRLVADLRLDVSESRTHPDEDPQQAKP